MDIIAFASEQWLLVGVLIALVFVFLWTENRRGGSTISIHAATREINQGQAVVVDLRETKEYKNGHIVDAINVPHNKVNDNLDQLNKHQDKTLILVDKMGQHTGSVGRVLKAKGFQISRLEGGMSEWQNQNLPLVK